VAVPLLAILRESTDLQIEHSIEPKHCVISSSQSRGSSDACNIDDGQVNSEIENSHHNQRMIFILRSANYSCMEEAALVLVALWRFTNKFYQHSDVFHRTRLNTNCESSITENIGEFQSSEPGNCPGSGEPKSSKMEMNKTFILPSLISCAMALSSLKIVEENDRFREGGIRNRTDDFDSNHGECENKIEKSSVEEGELDRGEECAMAILSCIQSFFELRNPLENNVTKIAPHLDGVACVINEVQESETSTFAQGVGTAMGGALVARLVQGCLSLLSQEAESVKIGVETHSRKKNAKLQLEALKTMRVFLEAIPMVGLWRSILPGCFAGLYQSTLSNLRYSSAASSHKVASESILVLVLLMQQSLLSPNPNMRDDKFNGDDADPIASSLLAIAKQCKLPGCDNEALPSKLLAADDKLMKLKMEVNSRLPGPLSLLLSLILTNNSNVLKKCGLDVCQLVLVDTSWYWDEENATKLGRRALEYCLTLLSHSDVILSQSARKVLRCYKCHLGETLWKRHLSQTIAPTILELLDMIPAFAQSGKELEVQNYLRLLNGYVIMSFRDLRHEFDLRECLLENKKSDVGSALSCSNAIEAMKRAFSVLLSPDVNSILYSPMIQNQTSSDHATVTKYNESFGCRFRYVRDDTIVAVKQSVRLISCAIGTKRSALVIDSCFAEMFESCSRMSSGKVIANHEHRVQLAGLSIFAEEMIAGICKWNEEENSTRLSRSSIRVISSLASSVLPVIVSHPVWTLPTSFVCEFTAKHTSQNMKSWKHRIDNKEITSKHYRHGTSAEVLNSNAIVIGSLMSFINAFSRAMGAEITAHMPIILFPLLERASPIGNHSYVQSYARMYLGTITKSAGYEKIADLIVENFDYMLDLISRKLQRHAKERSPVDRSLLGVIDVLFWLVAQQGDEPDKLEKQTSTLLSQISMVAHMLNSFLCCVDLQFTPGATQGHLMDIVRIFKSINAFMDSSISNQIDDCRFDTDHATAQSTEEWLRRLDFELGIGPFGHTEDDDFEEEEISNSDEPEFHGTGCNDNDDNDIPSFAKEIVAINCILSRCSYFMYNANLQIQISCCDIILSGFQSLGKIGSFRKMRYGEASSNPLLPAIAEFWPPMITRLRSTSSSLLTAKTLSRSDLSIGQIMATDRDEAPSQRGLEILISKLLEIASELCLISDGFFVDRFENDVYPILYKHLGDFLHGRAGRNNDFDRHSQSIVLLRKSMLSSDRGITESKSSILCPILICLECAYKSTCGPSLAKWIPSLGTFLLPFLFLEGDVGDAVDKTLKAMLTIDSDALWRNLHALYGSEFPSNPVKRSDCRHGNSSDVVLCGKRSRQHQSYDVALSRKAGELLDFIKSLPESNLC